MAAREGRGIIKGSFLEGEKHRPTGGQGSNGHRGFTEREIGFLISHRVLLYRAYRCSFYFYFDRQITNLDGAAAMMR